MLIIEFLYIFRYCRPIRFQFKKETSDLSKAEEIYFKEKISHLKETKIEMGCNTVIQINHLLQLTMIDGKICSALTETSSARCYICRATPKEMNDIEHCLQKATNEKAFEFGLSPLHAYIRFFEYFIHVSYKINIKKWQVRSIEEKQEFELKKREIQQEFRNRLGLHIDKPKSGGSGTSNDGNTARCFFRNSTISAEITGIPEELICRCSSILEALNSGYQINVQNFRDYGITTAKKLVEAFPWYCLPASIHKILIHGSEVISNCILSIGELSEEAAEAKNKDVKKFRLNHTRKNSREHTNLDLMNRLLLTSDPYISGVRKLPKKKISFLSKDAKYLITNEH